MKVISRALAGSVLLISGCAQFEKQMAAQRELTQRYDYFKDRVLPRESEDYKEFLKLQKVAWGYVDYYCKEHGDPDYILPGRGQFSDMSWVERNRTMNPFSGERTGLPDQVVAYIYKKTSEAEGCKIKGMTYDSTSRKGKISILVENGNFDAARAWARNYIAEMAKDKNVALVLGEVPRNAKFYLGNERIVDGNLLEIDFETE